MSYNSDERDFIETFGILLVDKIYDMEVAYTFGLDKYYMWKVDGGWQVADYEGGKFINLAYNPYIPNHTTPLTLLAAIKEIQSRMDLDTKKQVVQQMIFEIHDNAVEKGFWENERSVGESIALIHSELSEALEAARSGYNLDSHLPNHLAFEVELADAVIRIFDLAGSRDNNFVDALFEKIEYNKGRSRKHGKLF